MGSDKLLSVLYIFSIFSSVAQGLGGNTLYSLFFSLQSTLLLIAIVIVKELRDAN